MTNIFNVDLRYLILYDEAYFVHSDLNELEQTFEILLHQVAM